MDKLLKELEEQKECMSRDKFTNDMDWRDKGERIANHEQRIIEIKKEIQNLSI